MTLSELKNNLSTLPDEELIKMAGEMLGRDATFIKGVGFWVYHQDAYTIKWNPLESETDAFELVDFIYEKASLYFQLNRCAEKWHAEYLSSSCKLKSSDDSRTRAIVKASLLAWEYWKEMGK